MLKNFQLIGPPGVGKTAILEGLASRIVAKEVPEVCDDFALDDPDSHLNLHSFQSLQNKRVLSIDLSAIVAGSGIRGQFEEKFKALIRDIEEEVSCTPLGQWHCLTLRSRAEMSSASSMKFVSMIPRKLSGM